MAIDTERKRKSAAWVGQVFSPPTIVPDGSLVQGDRQTIGWGYYGILAAMAQNIGSADELAFTLFIKQILGPTFYVKKALNNNLYVTKQRSIDLER